MVMSAMQVLPSQNAALMVERDVLIAEISDLKQKVKQALAGTPHHLLNSELNKLFRPISCFNLSAFSTLTAVFEVQVKCLTAELENLK